MASDRRVDGKMSLQSFYNREFMPAAQIRRLRKGMFINMGRRKRIDERCIFQMCKFRYTLTRTGGSDNLLVIGERSTIKRCGGAYGFGAWLSG